MLTLIAGQVLECDALTYNNFPSETVVYLTRGHHQGWNRLESLICLSKVFLTFNFLLSWLLGTVNRLHIIRVDETIQAYHDSNWERLNLLKQPDKLLRALIVANMGQGLEKFVEQFADLPGTLRKNESSNCSVCKWVPPNAVSRLLARDLGQVFLELK